MDEHDKKDVLGSMGRAEPEPEKPLAERYAPRADKPEIYYLYKGDEQIDGYTSAFEAFKDFENHGGNDIELRAPDGERLMTRDIQRIEHNVSAWSGHHYEAPVTLSDNMKRDLVAEGRNPENPREPLASPVREAGTATPEPMAVSDEDMTAEQLRARLDAQGVERERDAPATGRSWRTELERITSSPGAARQPDAPWRAELQRVTSSPGRPNAQQETAFRRQLAALQSKEPERTPERDPNDQAMAIRLLEIEQARHRNGVDVGL
ncbi:hypothetical protein [Burkholderia ubonensis]|uniref:Uncharacterized protein n=1 Tax=Burkholderia ubonensis TaxID=101571 RepID=A0A1R1J7T3_9BURK|nr:hypothetical protein [Burkholderia ubonensis]OMG71395.1 hypothetical protein BW685_21375 [Burkholderia ubonensis]